jgi:ankyrin repeat protein
MTWFRNEPSREEIEALHEAARRADCPALAPLLKKYGKKIVNEKLGGVPALHQTIRPEIVGLLLDAGADIDARDVAGMTALMEAAMWGQDDIVKPLLKRNADIRLKDNGGITALMWAVRGGSLKIVRLLLDDGADIHEKDGSAKTALAWARERGKAGVIDLLEKWPEIKRRSDMDDIARAITGGLPKDTPYPGTLKPFLRRRGP